MCQDQPDVVYAPELSIHESIFLLIDRLGLCSQRTVSHQMLA